ncbi:MAG: hypothetical protein AAB353_09155 [Candidatus Hydrogenedentota bacterium]
MLRILAVCAVVLILGLFGFVYVFEPSLDLAGFIGPYTIVVVGQDETATYDIRYLETAATSLQAEAGVAIFPHLFAEPDALYADDIEETLMLHTTYVVDVLLHGREAAAPLKESIRANLGQQYVDIDQADAIIDPWGNPYRFYIPNPDDPNDPFRAQDSEALIFIFSAGANGVFEQPSAPGDDIISWDPARVPVPISPPVSTVEK